MDIRERETVANADRPDAGFRTVFGAYLGISATCLAVAAGVLVAPVLEVPRLAALGLVPTVLTVATAGGITYAGRVDGLSERIGRSPRGRATTFLPALTILIALLAALATPLEVSPRVPAALAGLAAIAVVPTVGVATMARVRYVAAVTADEPTVTCRWVDVGWSSFRRRFVLAGSVATALFGSVVGWVSTPAGGGLFALGLAVFFFESTRRTFSLTFGEPASALRVHEAGVAIENGGVTRFHPWRSILDVRLTDRELVLERHLFDLRGDRSAIDDPEAVLEAIARARRAADGNATAAP